MNDTASRDDLFWEYFSQWITIYKESAVRDVTLKKYRMS